MSMTKQARKVKCYNTYITVVWAQRILFHSFLSLYSVKPEATAPQMKKAVIKLFLFMIKSSLLSWTLLWEYLPYTDLYSRTSYEHVRQWFFSSITPLPQTWIPVNVRFATHVGLPLALLPLTWFLLHNKITCSL